MFGSPLLQAIPDVDHPECAIFVGTNPAVSQLSFVHLARATERLKAITRRGGRVVFVNPRRTESADQLGEQLLIRPGSDVYFFLAFAHVVCARVTLPVARGRYLEGADALIEAVRAFPPERVSDITSIDAVYLRALA